ncbi:PAS domain S-box protein [Eubacteriaceae bacterium ES3]|nr:PAS domain S-box protein [Eubacteriaceae bacterium ES3]
MGTLSVNSWFIVVTIGLLLGSAIAFIITYSRISALEKKNSQLKIWGDLINQTNEYVLLTNDEGIILKVNSAFLELLSKPMERVVGKSVLHFQIDFEFHEHRQQMLRSFAENGFYEFSLNLFLKNEVMVPLLVKITIYRDQDKTYYGISAVSTKTISEKEAIICEKNDELFEIQHLANIGYWEMHYHTKKIYWSKELYSLLGYDEKEVEPNLDFIHFMAHQDDQSRVWKAFLNAFQAQEKVDIHYRLKNHRGVTMEIFLRIRHFFSETNEHIRTIGMIQDISEQIELKEELDLQQVYTEAILSNSHLLFISFTNRFVIVSVNKLISELSGISEEELVGDSLMSAFGNLSRSHRKQINENLDFKGPLPLKDKNGKIHYIQWDHSTINLKDGQILNLLLGLDVTETIDQRKALEEALLNDNITGLPNRRKLNGLLTNYFKKNGCRNDKPLTLITFVVSGIEEIADAGGQLLVDKIMKESMKELNKKIGKYGLLAKQTSTQFAFFFPDDNKEKISEICQAIKVGFNTQFYIKRYDVKLSPFVGIAQFPTHTSNPEDLVRYAGIAMHKAQRENISILYFSDIMLGDFATEDKGVAKLLT